MKTIIQYSNALKKEFDLTIKQQTNSVSIIMHGLIGNRKQKIIIMKGVMKDNIIMKSQIIAQQDLPSKKGKLFNMLIDIFKKNRNAKIVNFILTATGTIEGRISLLNDTLDYEEFKYYIMTLAIDCDKLEKTLIDTDRN